MKTAPIGTLDPTFNSTQFNRWRLAYEASIPWFKRHLRRQACKFGHTLEDAYISFNQQGHICRTCRICSRLKAKVRMRQLRAKKLAKKLKLSLCTRVGQR